MMRDAARERSLPDDLDQHPLPPPAVKFPVKDLLPGPKSRRPLVTATTTSRPMTCRFRWASALFLDSLGTGLARAVVEVLAVGA